MQAGLVLDHAEVGLQQAGELARLGPRAAGAAVGAGEGREVDVVGVVEALLLGELLLEVVGPEPLVARLALGQRVGEGRDVAAGLPGLPRQDHRGVEADDVVAHLHHGLPPLALDVVLELDAQRAVVPGGPGAAVDLTAGVDESPPLREGDDIVDGGGRRLGHGDSFLWAARPAAGSSLVESPRLRGPVPRTSPRWRGYREASCMGVNVEHLTQYESAGLALGICFVGTAVALLLAQERTRPNVALALVFLGVGLETATITFAISSATGSDPGWFARSQGLLEASIVALSAVYMSSLMSTGEISARSATVVRWVVRSDSSSRAGTPWPRCCSRPSGCRTSPSTGSSPRPTRPAASGCSPASGSWWPAPSCPGGSRSPSTGWTMRSGTAPPRSR